VDEMRFIAGDRIKHKRKKKKEGVIQGIAKSNDKEIGYWFLEDDGSRWILQFDWEGNWEKVRK
jgi:hypothetical protein